VRYLPKPPETPKQQTRIQSHGKGIVRQ